MNHTGGAAHGTLHNRLVGVLLTLDLQVGIQGDGAEPVVAVVLTRGGLRVDLHTLHVREELLVEMLDALVVGDMVCHHGHLSAADAGADVAHAVVEADLLVLVVGVALPVLGRVHHDFAPFLLVGGNQSAAAGGGDHLVAVEREHAGLAEGAQHLAVELRAEALGGIFHHGDVVAVGDLHDAVDLVGHAVEGHRHDRLGFPAGLGDAVFDGLFHQIGVDVPGVLFGVHEHGYGAEVGDGVRGGAEGEALHDDLVAGFHACGDESEVDGSGAA